MKIKPLILIALCFIAIGCAAQKTLKEQDVEYYTQMKKVVTDFNQIFESAGPIYLKYLKGDKSIGKELGAPAEKARQQLVLLQKRISDIKPVSGQKDNHGYILARMKDYQLFAEDLIRISEGKDDLLEQSAQDFKNGHTDTLNEIFEDIDNFKE